MNSKERDQYIIVLADALSSTDSDAWLEAQRTVVHRVLVDTAFSLLDLETGRLDPEWDQLDDPVHRENLIRTQTSDKQFQDQLSGDLAAINAILSRLYYRPLNEAKSDEVLPAVVLRLRSGPSGGAGTAENPFPRVWRRLSERLASVVVALSPAAAGAGPTMVTRIDTENALVLTSYFRTTNLRSARLIRAHLTDAAIGLLGVRGSLVTIPFSVTSSGVVESLPSPPPPIRGRISICRPRPPFVEEVVQEAALIRSGRGFAHRVLDINAAANVPIDCIGLLGTLRIADQRTAHYRQFEHAVNAYLGLAAVEFLLRSYAARVGLSPIERDGKVSSALRLSQRLSLPAPARDALAALFSQDDMAVRHKIMHGALLEVSSRGMEVTMLASSQFASLVACERAPLSPESLEETVLHALLALDDVLHSRCRRMQLETRWVHHLALTDDQIELGLKLSCDFLGDEAEAWRQRIFYFLEALSPAFKQLASLGFVYWLRATRGTGEWLGVGFLAMVFEGLFRTTARLLGVPVIEVAVGTPGAHNFRYAMLDQRATGLLTGTVISALLEHIDPIERGLAFDVLCAAVNARDAFSHGAVVNLSERQQVAYGHIFLKSLQLLCCAAFHHMTREAAFYYYTGPGLKVDGFDLSNWLIAKRQVEDMVFAIGTRKLQTIPLA